MSKFLVNDYVFVPAIKLENLGEYPSAFYRTQVVDVGNRRIRVSLPNHEVSDWIGTGLCHKNVGILILTIGEDSTETTLLDPLAKSVLQYCRLLVPDDFVRSFKVRSLEELVRVWGTHQQMHSCVILIGHGSSEGLIFLVDGLVTAATLDARLRVYGAPKKVFVSLACQTGYKTFGAKMSRQAICSHFIGPFNSVHGAVASQFVQTFLAHHFLMGNSAVVAFKHAREATPAGASFRLWTNGALVTN